MNAAGRSIQGKHVVITGGAGFIGSHLADLVIRAGASDLTVVDNLFLGKEANLRQAREEMADLRFVRADTSDMAAMRAIFSSVPPVDVVFDLAVIPLPNSLVEPKWCFDTNVLMTSTICELLREGQFGSLVHFSSSEAYGTAHSVPMGESHPLSPLTPYAASKAASDHLVRTYASTFGVDALVVRPFNNYGPRQNEREYAGIIPTLLRCALEGRTFRLFGDGTQTRDYIYATDTVRAALKLYETPAARGCVVNVASGHEISMLDLIARIERILGRSVPIEHAPARPGDVQRHLADISLLKDLVAFEPEVALDDGLARTVTFYEDSLGGASVSVRANSKHAGGL